jgi:hypothetical protein
MKAQREVKKGAAESFTGSRATIAANDGDWPVDALEVFLKVTGTIAPIVASIAAIWVTCSFNSRQLKVAEAQAATADAQRKIAAARLNFDLFEKRYAVFEATRALWVDVVQNGDVNSPLLNRFLFEIADAEFLFESEVPLYLDAFRRRIIKLRRLHKKAETNDEKSGELEDEQMTELSDELPTLIATFKRYLKLGNIWNVNRHQAGPVSASQVLSLTAVPEPSLTVPMAMVSLGIAGRGYACEAMPGGM